MYFLSTVVAFILCLGFIEKFGASGSINGTDEIEEGRTMLYPGQSTLQVVRISEGSVIAGNNQT